MKLFEQDIFSTSTSYAIVADTIVGKLISVIDEHFCNLELFELRFTRIDGFNINSENWRLDTNSGAFLLKRKPLQIHVLHELKAQAAYSELLRIQYQLPLPRFCQTKMGELIATDISNMWVLQEYVDGAYYVGSEHEVITAAATLGQLYTACNESCKMLPNSLAIQPIDEMQRNRLLGFVRDEEQNRIWYGDYVAKICTEIEPLLAQINSRQYLGNYEQRSFHIDCHPHNILMKNGGVAAIVDWDSFRPCDPVSFIGFAAIKLCRQAIVNGTSSKKVNINFFDSLNHAARSKIRVEDAFFRGMGEIMRRMLFIYNSKSSGIESQWDHVLPVHIATLFEAKEMLLGCI